MKRTLLFVTAFAVFALVAGAAIAGTTLAQKGKLEHIEAQAKGDSKVVAIVQGKDLTQGAVRKPTQLFRAHNKSLTEDEATKLMIVQVVDNLIVAAEVERRKLTPSDVEVRKYMAPHKEACLGPHGADCRESIEDRGYSVKDFWDIAFDDYKSSLGSIKLTQAVFAEQSLTNADNKERVDASEDLKLKLRREAKIEWKDDNIRRLYQQALTED